MAAVAEVPATPMTTAMAATMIVARMCRAENERC
jgi:hypothetical protein